MEYVINAVSLQELTSDRVKLKKKKTKKANWKTSLAGGRGGLNLPRHLDNICFSKISWQLHCWKLTCGLQLTFPQKINSLLDLPRWLWQLDLTWYSRQHPTLSPFFVTSSFVQKDLFFNFCSWKGSPSPLSLLLIFLQKTLLVVDEPQFRAMATTTQRPQVGINGDVFSPGWCCRTYREHLEQGTRQNMLNRIHKKVCRTDLQVHVFWVMNEKVV